jgi:hypothetical protein
MLLIASIIAPILHDEVKGERLFWVSTLWGCLNLQ